MATGIDFLTKYLNQKGTTDKVDNTDNGTEYRSTIEVEPLADTADLMEKVDADAEAYKKLTPVVEQPATDKPQETAATVTDNVQSGQNIPEIKTPKVPENSILPTDTIDPETDKKLSEVYPELKKYGLVLEDENEFKKLAKTDEGVKEINDLITLGTNLQKELQPQTVQKGFDKSQYGKRPVNVLDGNGKKLETIGYVYTKDGKTFYNGKGEEVTAYKHGDKSQMPVMTQEEDLSSRVSTLYDQIGKTLAMTGAENDPDKAKNLLWNAIQSDNPIDTTYYEKGAEEELKNAAWNIYVQQRQGKNPEERIKAEAFDEKNNPENLMTASAESHPDVKYLVPGTAEYGKPLYTNVNQPAVNAALYYNTQTKWLINAGEGEEKRDKGFLSGAKGLGLGLVHGIRNSLAGGFGVNDAAQITQVLGASKRLAEGKDTKDDDMVLDAYLNYCEAQQVYNKKKGYCYSIGENTAQSIPFMLEFIVNPLAGAGEAAVKGVTRKLISRYGADWVRKNVKTLTNKEVRAVVERTLRNVGAKLVGKKASQGVKNFAGKALARTADLAGYGAASTMSAGAMSLTTGLPQTYAGAVERQLQDGDTASEAWRKEFLSGMNERGSEFAGPLFKPFLKGMGKAIAFVPEKLIGKDRLQAFGKALTKTAPVAFVSEFVDDVANSGSGKLVKDFVKKTHWDGFFEEDAEEVFGSFMDALVIGDQHFLDENGKPDFKGENSFFNIKERIDEAVNVGFTTALLGAGAVAGYRTPKYRMSKELKKYEAMCADAFGKDWAGFKATIDACKPEQISSVIVGCMQAGAPAQKMTALAKYAISKSRLDASVKLEQGHRFNPDSDQDEVSTEEAYDNGYTLEGQQRNDAKNRLEDTEKTAAGLLHLDNAGDVQSAIGLTDDNSNAVEVVKTINGRDDLNDYAKQKLTEYVNARVAMQGVIDAAKDDIDTQIQINDQRIDNQADEDGNVCSAQLKNGTAVYVRNGKVSIDDKGEVVTSESDNALVVQDQVSGELQMVPASDVLKVANVASAEQLKTEAANAIRMETAQKYAQEIDGVLPFNVGDVYNMEDEDGKPLQVEVVADLGNGNVNVNWNGANISVPSSQIQALNDTYNHKRLAVWKTSQEPADGSAKPTEERESPLAQIPVDENGVRQYTQAAPLTSYDALVEATGSADGAQQVIEAEREKAQKALDRAMRTKPQGNTTDEIVESARQIYNAKQEAEATFRYWDAVGRVPAYRDEAKRYEAHRESYERRKSISKAIGEALVTSQLQEESAEAARFNELASQIDTLQGEEKQKALEEMSQIIAIFAKENGYEPVIVPTYDEFIQVDALAPQKKAIEDAVSAGEKVIGFYYHGKIYLNVEHMTPNKAMNAYELMESTLVHESVHEDNDNEGKELVSVTADAIRSGQVDIQEALDIIEAVSGSKNYARQADEMTKKGKDPAEMIADELMAHMVQAMSWGVPVESLTNNETLTNIINQEYEYRERVRSGRADISERSEVVHAASEGVGRPSTGTDGERASGEHGRGDTVAGTEEEGEVKAEENTRVQERREKIKSLLGAKYSLSSEEAVNGEMFCQNKEGSTELATIPDEIFESIGRNPVPFKLTETMAWHVYDHHKNDLGLKDISEAIDFVLDVVNNVDHVRLGRDNSYIFSIENGRKRKGKRAVAIIVDGATGEFMGIRTSGYESLGKLEERPLLWNRSAEADSEDVATPTITTIEPQQGDERTSRTKGQSNVSSAGKDTESSVTEQGKSEKKDTSSSNVEITDVGEKIGGAKKDLYKEMQRQAEENSKKTDEELSAWMKGLSVGKIFAFDLEKLRKDGLSNEAATFIQFVKGFVPAKPRAEWKLKRWFGQAMTLYRLCLMSATDFKQVQSLIGDGSHNKILEGYQAMMAIGGFDSGLHLPKDTSLVHEKDGAEMWSKTNGNVSIAGKWSVYVGYQFSVYDTYEEAVAALKKLAGQNAVDEKKEIKFAVYRSAKDGSCYITPKGKSNAILAEGFETSTEAFKYIREHNAELQERYRTLMTGTKVELGENRERKGRNWRGGKDVSADEFRETFGFRGVEFGNWMKQEDRRKALNECYDALMDMADVCGVSPLALSLDGKLGMAFGSRGGGNYNAHYEPGKEVINLTKTKGAGSLAHEWFHALDNYFAKMGGAEAGGFATSLEGISPKDIREYDIHKKKVYYSSSQHKYLTDAEYEAELAKHPVRKEMAAAWKHLSEVIRNSAYGQRSRSYASLHTKYWQEPTEMGARAFSVWVENELSKRNATNDYLANNPALLEEALDDEYKRFSPYPFNTDAEWMDEAFGNLFNTMQEKVDEETGHHVLFSVRGNEPRFSVRLQDAIADTETNPSDAQKKSGNYKKGHVKFGGYDYTIENPKGSTRSGKEANGKEWKVTMHDTYGYIRGTFGKDGDHLDMFINDSADLDNWNGNVYVIDQVNSDGTFDEHKVMYGYDTEEDAKKAYLANYSKGWKGLGNITGVSKDTFDKWVDSSNRKMKPFAEYKGIAEPKKQEKEDVSLTETEVKESLRKKITGWLTDENVEWAEGKDLKEIIERFGNTPEPIAVMPSIIRNNVPALGNDFLYCGKAYMIDHQANHHPEIGIDEYGNIQTILDSYDDIKDLSDGGNLKIAFVKKLDKGYAVVAELSKEGGKIILHKTFFYRDEAGKRIPYKNKPSILEKWSVDGSTTISPVDKQQPADTENISALDLFSADKVTNNQSEKQEKGGENLQGEGKFSFIGEKDAKRADHAEDVTREDQMFLFGKGGESRSELSLEELQERVRAYDAENGTELGRFVDFIERGRVLNEGEKSHFKIGKAGNVLRHYGIKGDIFASTETESERRHTRNADHGLTPLEWVETMESVNTPLVITRYRGNSNRYRVYTFAIKNGKSICLGMDVKNNEHAVEISNIEEFTDIRTAFGRDIEQTIRNEDIIYPEGSSAEEQIRQNFAQSSAAHNSQLYEQNSVSGANVVNSSETASISEGNVDDTPKFSITKATDGTYTVDGEKGLLPHYRTSDKLPEKLNDGKYLTNYNRYAGVVRNMGLNTAARWQRNNPARLPYRDIFETPSLEDYYTDTRAEFEGVDLKGRSAGEVWNEMKESGKYDWHKSPKSDSEYLIDTKTGEIYRKADHWGRVASCSWRLDNFDDVADANGYAIAHANIKDFKPNRNGRNTVDNPYTDEFMHEIRQSVVNYTDALENIPMTDKARSWMTEAREGMMNLLDWVKNNNSTNRQVRLSIVQANRKFNEELDEFTLENADNFIFDLGKPSEKLIAAGVADMPIRLYGSKLAKKIRSHGYSAKELKNLPLAMENPIAIFDNLERKGNRSVLTELKTADGNFLVTIDLGKGLDADFDIVSSVFGKKGNSIVNWINKGLLKYVDKEKALNYLHLSAPIAEASNKSELNSATKVIQGFENPSILEGNVADTPKFSVISATDFINDISEKGVSGVLGKETVDKFADDLYMNNADIRREINKGIAEAGFDYKKATRNWFGKIANGDVTPKQWHDIRTAFQKMLRDNGINAQLSDGDVAFALWKETNPGNDIFTQAKDISKQMDLGAGRFSVVAPNAGMALDEYNRKALSKKLDWQEAWQDAMISVKALQDAVAQETGTPISDSEDVYHAENRMYGAGKNEAEFYMDNYLEPLLHEIDDVLQEAKQKGVRLDYNGLNDYLMAKHGIERNSFFALRAMLDEAQQKKVDAVTARLKAKAEQDYQDALNAARQLADPLDMLKAVKKANSEKRKADAQAERTGIEEGRQLRESLYDRYVNDPDLVGLKDDYRMKRIDFRQYETLKRGIMEKHLPGVTQRIVEQGDKAGLSNIMDDDTDFENLAFDFVTRLEGTLEIRYLWDRVNDATKATLKKSYGSGKMTKKAYDYVSGMFDFYVPLRGWDETTADEVYEYENASRPVFTPSVKKMFGRQSKAEDPIAYIGNMAVSEISSGNKNLMKQYLLRLAQNHPTSAMSVSEVWYENIGTPSNEQWVEVAPNIKEGMSGADITAEMERFRNDMEQKRQQGLAKRQRERLSVGMPILPMQEQEHRVDVMVDGKKYSIFLNGSPKAAQAVNGTNKADVNFWVGDSWLQKTNRFISEVLTSKNPAFVPANFTRDMLGAHSQIWIKENASYIARFEANVAKVLLTPRKGGAVGVTGYMPQLLRKWQKGTLDMNNDIERYFSEFMTNGGETGYVNILGIEEFKEDIAKKLNNFHGHAGKNAWQAVWDTVEFYNRAVEDTTRFVTYMTSRQQGRSVDRSIDDAKTISLNFNRKGSGKKGNALLRKLVIFVNPAIQALDNQFKLISQHPARYAGIISFLIMRGMAQSKLNELLISIFGDDDDKNAYYSIPEWTRRNNFIMWIPGTHNWFKIPLSQEFRLWHGLGETIQGVIDGRTKSNPALELATSMLALLPVDPTGNGGNPIANVTPTFLKPVYEITENENFLGLPIYLDSDYNKYEPEFQRVTYGTPSWMTKVSEDLNSLTGGDTHEKGWLEESLQDNKYARMATNPSVWNHLLSGYMGGPYNLISQSAGLVTDLAGGEGVKVGNIPVVSRFMARPIERETAGKLDDHYRDLLKEAEETRSHYSHYKKDYETAALNGDEKAMQEAQTKMNRILLSDDFLRMRTIEAYDKHVEKLRQLIRKTDDKETKESYNDILRNLESLLREQLEPEDKKEEIKK